MYWINEVSQEKTGAEASVVAAQHFPSMGLYTHSIGAGRMGKSACGKPDEFGGSDFTLAVQLPYPRVHFATSRVFPLLLPYAQSLEILPTGCSEHITLSIA